LLSSSFARAGGNLCRFPTHSAHNAGNSIRDWLILWAGAREIKRNQFFFEKKNQKTFICCRGLGPAPAQKSKSVLLLFFKKEDFSS